MFVYISGTILSILLASICQHHLKANNLAKALIAGFPLFLISAMRFDIGTDYNSYYQFFLENQNGFFFYEPLYNLLGYIVIQFSNNFQWIIVITSAIYIYTITYTLFRDSPNPPLSIFFLVTMVFYFDSFNIIRQCIGCAFVLMSLRYVVDRNPLKFSLCIFVASGFHTSCLVFFPVYFIPLLNFTIRKAVIFLSSFVVMLLPLRFLFNILIELTPYSKYIGGQYDTFAPASVIGIFVQFALFCFVSYRFLDNEKFKVYYCLQTISLCLTIFGIFHVLVGRLQYPFSIHSIITIPMALSNYRQNKEKVLIKLVIIICYILYCFVIVFLLKSNEVYPYQCVLTRMKFY